MIAAAAVAAVAAFAAAAAALVAGLLLVAAAAATALGEVLVTAAGDGADVVDCVGHSAGVVRMPDVVAG